MNRLESPRGESAFPIDTQGHCGVIELRQYTLHPGRRESLIELFEREFVDAQEACGMRLLGEFRDLDDPDRFVWLRGFRDMPARARSLEAFYSGPVWRFHRETANATMLDSDNVLLLRPARTEVDRFDAAAYALVVALIWQMPLRVGADFAGLFERRVTAELLASEGRILATWSTEHASNTFPALPVREGENVFVSLVGFGTRGADEDVVDALAAAGAVNLRAAPDAADPQVLRLIPILRAPRSSVG